MSVGARVNTDNEPGGDLEGTCSFGGWSHMVNLVTIRGEIYMVDVGFGSGGPTRPMALKEGSSLERPINYDVRLRHDAIAENERVENKLWLFERRRSDDGPWQPLYCFEDIVCFLPQDFEVMNFFTSTNRTCYFTYKVIASRYLLEDGNRDRLIGDVVCYERSVHRRIGGKKEMLATLNTEQERIDALKKFLGITLNEAQKAGIKGMCTEIRS